MRPFSSTDASHLVQNSLSDRSYKRPWLYCFIATLFFFYEFVQMNMFNALNPGLMQAFSLNATQLGSLSACYFYAVLISLFPAGLLLDHIAAKKLILTTMSVSVMGTFLFSISHSFILASLSRFLSGLGGAFAFQSSLRIAADYFPPSRLALVNGLIVTFAMSGGILAQTPMTLLAETFTWREVLWAYISMGVFFLFIIAIVLPKHNSLFLNRSVIKTQPIETGLTSADKLTQAFHGSETLVAKKIKRAFFNRQTWLGSLYTTLFNLPVPLLGATWGNLYLTHTHHLSRIEASNVLSLLFLGIIMGCPLFGGWSDHIKNRILPMLLGGVIALIILLIIIHFPDSSKTSQTILFFLLGLFSSAQIIGYSVVADGNPHSRSTGLGIASLLVMSGGAVIDPFFGWLVDYHWNGAMVQQLRVYTADDFKFAMQLLPIAFGLGLMMVFFLKKNLLNK